MDDMISRRAVLDKFEPWLKVKDYNDGELNMLKAILYEIRFMPPATDKNVGTKLGTNLAEVGTDCISRQQAIDAFNTNLNELVVGGEENAKTVENYLNRVLDKIKCLPSAQPEVLACGEGELSAQPERTCVNCGRTVNNGGWYADGRTRCPIEEHYALPKDGYCHLWEKRNVTDDDYPERREE